MLGDIPQDHRFPICLIDIKPFVCVGCNAGNLPARMMGKTAVDYEVSQRCQREDDEMVDYS